MKKNILVYIIFSFLLFVGSFLCGEYITNMFHRLDEPLKKFDLNIKYTQEIKQLVDAVIEGIKKNPQETILKLEKLQREINISYEGVSLDKVLLDAGFEAKNTYSHGN